MAFETFAVHAACIRGVEAIPVTVEVSLAGGIPGIQMLGIPSMEVMESRGRIRCAMRSAGFEIPRSGITVNLAPGDIRKTGSGFDLPIAIAVLAADGQIPRDNLDRCLIAGELGLDGTVLPVKGEVAFQLLARDMGLSFIAGRSDQHVPLAGVDCGFIDHLSQLARGMGEAARHYLDSEGVEATFEPELDYADVLGQEVAKRGMALAAAGELGLLMIGSPGSGKTMLARRMTGILPELSVEDQQEALCIHSVLGENIDGLLAGHRPFRSPHHSISTAGLIGGGRPVHPGEISLAHGGVLFLDRACRVSNRCAADASSAYRARVCQDRARRRRLYVSLTLSAACGEQSLPLRLFGRSRGSVSLLGIDGRALSVQASRPPGRPY